MPVEYSNYSNNFSAENTSELLENTGVNKYAIKLEERMQPLFGPIYSLGLVELETLKTYIETKLANGFIQSSMSPAGSPIFFDWELDGSFHLCVDYWGLNNITIKNRYPLSLIGKSIDWLCQVKRFTQLDLTNAYHWIWICEGDE